jgi:hypothetical protein
MDSTVTHFEVPTEVVPAIVTTAATDRCGNCAAQMAADQRYCLECGERRGDPRMPYMNGRPQVGEPISARPARARRSASAANTTLVAGVGTLLLAMGVGVLIGRSNGDTRVAKAPPVQVVTVAGVAGAVASGAPASSSTPADTTSGATTDGAKAKANAGKGATSKSATKGVPKASAPVVKVGAKGKGKGYNNGKFTGDFFGQ